ncbi:FxSxx-COOH system tetratricopeptide repeat protein [Streptomyces sp. NPDC006733]|uniref:FxSxx-COOH system tetratricopeptide repeat protein n=1 Tax=Streptomyces sp. NPDC006733 TaxID=3155460 RepID=UPI0033DDC70F
MRSDNDQGPQAGPSTPLQSLRALSRLRGPDGQGRPEVLLVIDSCISMKVWDETIAAAAEELAGLESLGGVETVQLLGTDDTQPGRIALERPETPLGGNRVVLVVTNGLAAGWRSDAVLPLLRTWAMAGPLAVLHLLPQHLWFRTGLDAARVTLAAPRPWVPNTGLVCALRETPLEALDDEAEAEPAGVPVPVLEATERWISAWVALIGGQSGDGLEMSAVQAREWKRRPDAARAAPWADHVPDPGSAVPARERVSEFRAGASPVAFELATRLAAAPLTFPVMRSVLAGMPAADPVHLTELLMSGLVRPSGRTGEGSADVAFLFGPEIREELLALGRRSDTARVLHDVRSLLRDDPEHERPPLLPSASEALDNLAMPAVTHRNIAFHRVELTALRALSGRFLQRAKALAGVVSGYDRANAVSLAKRNRRPPGRPPAPSAPQQAPHTPQHGDPGGRATMTEGTSVRTTVPEPTAEGEGTRSTQPRVWGNIPPRNPNFTGRLELLDLLSQRLREGTTTVLPEAIHGMGGVGKTQLAIEYAYRHQAEYDVVWWIPAERPGQIGQALVELAQRLGLDTTREANSAGPAVREALREGRPYARWLLIFDNAESPERVRHYFPTGGSGTILVTSRNRRWGLVGSSLEVDVFTREESKELLRRSGPPLRDDEADRLADALGDLPLALEQAAAWRTETGMPVSEYLRLFGVKRAELLEVSPPPDYQLPVAAAWNVSLDHLETRSPAALRLLQLCSYFAPDPISRSIFAGLGNNSIDPDLDAALNDPMRLARAIREINRYSLARIDHRTNSLEMHRLVQAVLINRMTPEEQDRMRRGAHTLLAAADPNAPRNAADWPRYAELYGHVIASRAVESDQPWVRQLVMNISQYLYYWGDHDVAVDFSEEAWKVWQAVFGAEDQQSRLMGRWLGYLYVVTGRHHDAAQLVAQLKEIFRRTAPADGEDTREDALDALNLEAAVHRVQGEFAAGVPLDEMAYDRARRTFGEDDPTTLNTAHNLGVSLRLTGEFRRALELDQHTQNLKMRVFGQDDQRTLITQNGYAIDVRESGDYIRARSLQQNVLDGYRSVLGPGNPATLKAMRQLSEVCRKAGDQAASLEFAQQAFAQLTRRYGDSHPESLAAALALSVALRWNGDLEAARDRGSKACERYRRIFDGQHPHVLSADVGLAVTLRLLGRLDEARRLDEAALASLTDRLGAGHPTALACAINLASDLSALGEADAARDLGQRTLGLCRTSLGEDHPTTLVCAGNLSLDLIATGAADEGAALREDTLARMTRVLDAPKQRFGQPGPHPATEQVRTGGRANCDIDPLAL